MKSGRRSGEGDNDSDTLTDDSVSTISARGETNLASEEVGDNDIILDANREVRAKLYLGSVSILWNHDGFRMLMHITYINSQVPMGWFWFVPTFHMAHDQLEPVHLKLTRKDVDFPLGAGSWIVDIDVELEWIKAKAKSEPSAIGGTQGPVAAATTEEPALSGPERVASLGDEGSKEATEAAKH